MTYVLGHQSPSGQKAEMGTIVHKVMEGLACAKKSHQDKKTNFTDEVLGKIDTSNKKYINSDSFVDDLVDKSYEHYVSKSTHHWTPRFFKNCKEWSYQAITHCDGAFDPRKRNIVEPEIAFDFEIDEDWAEYDHTLPNGEKLKGKLSMKGTIDLVTEVKDGVFEVIDWKTGRRLDWATGKEKSFKKLTTDPQLRIYHYALANLYPDIDQFIMTMYFIKDGGPYTLAYTKNDIEETKSMIAKRFKQIKSTSIPRLIKSWKCTKICHFGKTAHSSGEIDPNTGEPYTICEYISNNIKTMGMDFSIENDINPNHHFDHYEAPG